MKEIFIRKETPDYLKSIQKVYNLDFNQRKEYELIVKPDK
jgi:hypothetical protein